MDGTPWLVGQIVNTYDLNNIPKDARKGLAWACSDILGTTSTVVTGFATTETAPTGLAVQVAAGQIYQLAVTEANPIGSFPVDTAQIMQQGHADAQSVSLNNSGLIAGQEKTFLIQVEFLQRLIIRPGDPQGGRRAFYNSAKPSAPLDGVDGLGGSIPTCNNGWAKVTAIAGSPAGAGTSVAPAPSSGCVPLFTVKVAYGQTSILNANIGIHPDAPYLAGLLQSHHKGLPGHAPKIQLGGVNKEVQGIIDLINTPAVYTGGGFLSNIQRGAANPNGTAAGEVGAFYYQTGLNQLWTCSTAGTTSTAVWTSVGTFGISYFINTFPFNGTAAGNNTYQCDTSAGVATANLPTAASMGGTGVTYTNCGTNILNLQPATGERIYPLATNQAMPLLPGNSITLSSRTAYGWYISSTLLKYLPVAKSTNFAIIEPSGALFLVTATSANITGTLPVSTGDGTVFKACIVAGAYSLILSTSGGQTITAGGASAATYTIPANRSGVVEIVAIPGGWLVT